MDELLGPCILEEVVFQLNGKKIPYWLDFGTLLGIVRNKKLIPWDHDIDLGTFEKNKPNLLSLVPKFEMLGYEVFDWGDELIFKKGGVCLGICFYITDDYYAYYPGRMGTRNLLSFIKKFSSYLLMIPNYADNDQKYKSYFKRVLVMFIVFIMRIIPYRLRKFLVEEIFKKNSEKDYMIFDLNHYKVLDNIKAYGSSYTIPSDTEKFLEKVYGFNWKVPKVDWKFDKDFGGN